jgi:glycosyltransferase involved in cell wall biosynthesis
MSSAPDLISVIIPARDRAHVIGFQLDALADQRTERTFEVIVADNGSTDDTVAVAQSYANRFARLEVVEASARRGAGHARNMACRVARGDVLLFCDSDDVAHADWLETMVRAWVPGSIVAGRIYPMRLAPHAPRCDDMTPPNRRPVVRSFLPFGDGGNVAIGRLDLQWIGGWDESFRFSQDVELSWRAQVAGMAFINAPEAVIFKRGAPQGWIRFRQYHRWGRAATRLYRRYQDQGMARRPMPKVVRSWAVLGYHALRGTVDLHERDLAVRQAGWYTGYLAGSVRHRVWYL